MILKFDREKLCGILTDFSKITGISIALIDSDFVRIAHSDGEACGFCKMLQAEDNCYRCKCSDNIMLERCRISKKAEIHICHAGLGDAALPIVSEGRIIAYIILGRIGKTKDFDSVLEKIPWFCGDITALRKEFDKLVHYNDDEIRSVANIAVAVASYILGDGAIRVQNNEIAEKASAYILENLDKRITVSMLCRKTGVSKNLLYESFKNAYGCTVKEYVNDKRIARAIKLLEETDMTVSEIADCVGINNHTYFSRLMLQRLGMTPLKYRKSLRMP